LIDWEAQICPDLRLEPTRGHTPGHVSIHISSAGQGSVITGDMTHHPCQLAHPEWGSVVDTDFDGGIPTRRSFYERYVESGTLVIGTHFSTPAAGHILRDGENYRLDVSRTKKRD